MLPCVCAEPADRGSVDASEILQVASTADKLAGALHNLGSDVDRERARITWTECYLAFHNAKCDLRKRLFEPALRNLAIVRDNFAELLELARRGTTSENDYVRCGERALEALTAALADRPST